MDFWTAIGDVSGVVTIATAALQAGKALFKKRLYFGTWRQSLSKKIFTLVQLPKVLQEKRKSAQIGHYLTGSYARQTDVTIISGNHDVDILFAPHHGVQKKLI
jgi:hypothetical protein